MDSAETYVVFSFSYLIAEAMAAQTPVALCILARLQARRPLTPITPSAVFLT